MPTTKSAPCHVVRPPSPGRSQSAPRSAPSRVHQDQIGEGNGHDPDGDRADVAPDEADGAGEAKRQRQRAERERPRPPRLEAEELVGECGSCRGDDEQLEDGPAQRLHDVDRGRDERALLAERRPQEHHRGHACLRTDSRRGAEHRAAEGGADEDREHCVQERQRGHEDRSRTTTSRETPRFAQRSPVSKPPSTRSRFGTGSMPQLCDSSSGTRGESTARRSRSADERLPVRRCDGLGAVVDAQLRVDVLDVGAHGLRADHQPVSDLDWPETLGEQPQHLLLPRCQPLPARPDRRSRGAQRRRRRSASSSVATGFAR